MMRGKVGGDMTLEQGREAARMTALSILATLQAELGDLGIQGHLRRIRKDDVIGAGVEISQPPRLSCRLLAQQCEHGPAMLVLPLASVRQHDRGVGLEDRGARSGDGQAVAVWSTIHATSASVPIRHVLPSLAYLTTPPA
jgi:hypothetical protein